MDERDNGHWIRFEDIDGRVVEDMVRVDRLPAVGDLLPVRGTHCEIMEEWRDRALVPAGGPEIVVLTVKPLV